MITPLYVEWDTLSYCWERLCSNAGFLVISVNTYVNRILNEVLLLQEQYLKVPVSLRHFIYLPTQRSFRSWPRSSLAHNPSVTQKLSFITLLLLYKSVRTIRVRLFTVFALNQQQSTFLMRSVPSFKPYRVLTPVNQCAGLQRPFNGSHTAEMEPQTGRGGEASLSTKCTVMLIIQPCNTEGFHEESAGR